MNPSIRMVAMVVIGLWVVTVLMLLHTPESPYKPIGTDYVEPTTVHPGGVISIYRSYVGTRDDVISVTRMMVKGDCKANCEYLDLAQGSVLIAPGEFLNVRREHVIPMLATPGIWKLRFAVHWQDALGRITTMNLPELSIEVTP